MMFHHGNPTATEAAEPTGDMPVIIRTNGGWLEVATVAHNRAYSRTQAATFLGFAIPYCETDAHIAVKAYFTYRVRLAEEWHARITSDRHLIVSVPTPEPALPVAFDTGTLRKSMETCIFAPNQATIDTLERGISAKLSREAQSEAYTDFVRDGAKQTVAEFVERWLVTQNRYQFARDYPIVVTFEPKVGS